MINETENYNKLNQYNLQNTQLIHLDKDRIAVDDDKIKELMRH